jgi:RNA polymerase sigma-70 factor (ECF subfamily)
VHEARGQHAREQEAREQNAREQDAALGLALDAARAGDEAGFRALFRALQPLLLRYLRVVIPAAAEDIASEVWLKAARELGEIRGDGTAFRVWLFHVARNQAVDELRRRSRRRESPVPPGDIEEFADGAAADGLDDGCADTASSALERLSTDRALRLVAALPKDQAEAVLLRIMVGLDVARTAEVLGKSRGAVRINTMRGLRRLAGLLDRGGSGDGVASSGSGSGPGSGPGPGHGPGRTSQEVTQ